MFLDKKEEVNKEEALEPILFVEHENPVIESSASAAKRRNTLSMRSAPSTSGVPEEQPLTSLSAYTQTNEEKIKANQEEIDRLMALQLQNQDLLEDEQRRARLYQEQTPIPHAQYNAGITETVEEDEVRIKVEEVEEEGAAFLPNAENDHPLPPVPKTPRLANRQLPPQQEPFSSLSPENLRNQVALL